MSFFLILAFLSFSEDRVCFLSHPYDRTPDMALKKKKNERLLEPRYQGCLYIRADFVATGPTVKQIVMVAEACRREGFMPYKGQDTE